LITAANNNTDKKYQIEFVVPCNKALGRREGPAGTTAPKALSPPTHPTVRAAQCLEDWGLEQIPVDFTHSLHA
jgi:hypothetical protein